MTFEEWMDKVGRCHVNNCSRCLDIRQGWDMCYQNNVEPLVEVFERFKSQGGMKDSVDWDLLCDSLKRLGV